VEVLFIDQGAELFTFGSAADYDFFSVELVEIECMKRLAAFVHNKVSDICHVIDTAELFRLPALGFQQIN